MILKGKYKIARRLGPHIFEKTQTRKFADSLARRKGADKGRPKQQTDFGIQLLEKQRVRFSYGIGERQFSKYVKNIIEKKGVKQDESLYQKLETRLDNAAYRLGFAPTRQAARQMVSHGHLLVDGVRVDIPSYSLAIGNKIQIRPGSLKKPLFLNLSERLKNYQVPSWLLFNPETNEAQVQGMPKLVPGQSLFDLSVVLEYYKR